MKVHDIIEQSVEWVAYDGVLGELRPMLSVWFEPSTHSPSSSSFFDFQAGGGGPSHVELLSTMRLVG
jgi:hypothetical protein